MVWQPSHAPTCGTLHKCISVSMHSKRQPSTDQRGPQAAGMCTCAMRKHPLSDAQHTLTLASDASRASELGLLLAAAGKISEDASAAFWSPLDRKGRSACRGQARARQNAAVRASIGPVHAWHGTGGPLQSLARVHHVCRFAHCRPTASRRSLPLRSPTPRPHSSTGARAGECVRVAALTTV